MVDQTGPWLIQKKSHKTAAFSTKCFTHFITIVRKNTAQSRLWSNQGPLYPGRAAPGFRPS